jgi:hypothetical protein
MENVPQIVSQRLKAAAPAVDHPDADVLTAFTEQSLPERERAQVLEHLARCVDCRDVLALSLPASESVQPIFSPTRSGWMTWPTLRWGFAAAGVIVIASLGILQYQRRLQPGMTTYKESAPQAAVKVAKNEPLPAPSQVAADRGSKLQIPAAPAFTDTLDANGANEKKSTARAEAPQPRELPATAGASPQALQHPVSGPLPHGPRLANQWQQTSAFQNQAPVPAAPKAFGKEQAGALPANGAPPAVSETVEVASAAPQLDAQAQDAQQLQNLPASSQGQIARAKPVVNSAPSQSTHGAALALSVQIPQWTIDASGGLQRSFDQGNTWQAVDVTTNSAYATSLEVVAKTARAKSKDEDKALKRDDASITFRAVAASGSDVWAGGSAGALYHSTDAGNHWTRLVPAASGAALTGDILSLDFADVQHGRITTSNNEVWITSDDGQTWQKQ